MCSGFFLRHAIGGFFLSLSFFFFFFLRHAMGGWFFLETCDGWLFFYCLINGFVNDLNWYESENGFFVTRILKRDLVCIRLHGLYKSVSLMKKCHQNHHHNAFFNLFKNKQRNKQSNERDHRNVYSSLCSLEVFTLSLLSHLIRGLWARRPKAVGLLMFSVFSSTLYCVSVCWLNSCISTVVSGSLSLYIYRYILIIKPCNIRMKRGVQIVLGLGGEISPKLKRLEQLSNIGIRTVGV